MFVYDFTYTMIIDIKENKIRIKYENIQADTQGADLNYSWVEIKEYLGNIQSNLQKVIIEDSNDKDW